MAFNRDKDVELDSKEVLNDENNVLTIGIYQYDGGVPKVQIKREITKSDGERKFAKLGRLTLDEVEAVKEGLIWAHNSRWLAESLVAHEPGNAACECPKCEADEPPYAHQDAGQVRADH